MTKKEQNNLLLIGAAAVAIWYFMKNKKPFAARFMNKNNTPILSAGENMQRAIDNTKFIPAIESDEKTYKKDITKCAI